MKTILVCTDFSTTGNNALKYAVQYATTIKCHLVVFNVVRMARINPTISQAVFLELEKKEESIQQQRLESLVGKIYLDLHLKKNARRVSVVAKNGIFITETLVAAAKDQKVDLIIVGTHGATGLKLFGSISSEIIFKASAPVLAIPPRYRYRKLKTIVYSSDLKNLVNELRCIAPVASPEKAVIEILNLNFVEGNAKPIIDEKYLAKQVKYKWLKIIVQKERPGLTIIEQLQRYLKINKPEILVMFL